MKETNREIGKRYEELGEKILISLDFEIVEKYLHYQHTFDRIVRDKKTNIIYGVNIKGINSCDYNKSYCCTFKNLYRCSKFSIPTLFLVVNNLRDYFLFEIKFIAQSNKQMDLDKNCHKGKRNYDIVIKNEKTKTDHTS